MARTARVEIHAIEGLVCMSDLNSDVTKGTLAFFILSALEKGALRLVHAGFLQVSPSQIDGPTGKTSSLTAIGRKELEDERARRTANLAGTIENGAFDDPFTRGAAFCEHHHSPESRRAVGPGDHGQPESDMAATRPGQAMAVGFPA
jgi:hypothetical protein